MYFVIRKPLRIPLHRLRVDHQLLGMLSVRTGCLLARAFPGLSTALPGSQQRAQGCQDQGGRRTVQVKLVVDGVLQCYFYSNHKSVDAITFVGLSDV